MTAHSRLLSIDDVSAWLGVPVNTLRYWRARGTGPAAARIGRRVVFREEDVQQWVDAHFAAAAEHHLSAG